MSINHTTRSTHGAIAPHGRTLKITQASSALQTLVGNWWRCEVEDRTNPRGKVVRSCNEVRDDLDDLLKWISDNWGSLKLDTIHVAKDIEPKDLKKIKSTLRPTFKKHRAKR